MMRAIEEFIGTHPKVAVALVALIVALVEALTGVTVEVGDLVGVG